MATSDTVRSREPDDGALREQAAGRTKAEAALAVSEEQFRLLVGGVQDYAIFMLDPTGQVLTWNAGAERIKGYRAEEVVGKHFAIFYTPEDRATGRTEKEL